MKAFKVWTIRHVRVDNLGATLAFKIIAHEIIRGRSVKDVRERLGLSDRYEVELMSPDQLKGLGIRPTIRDRLNWVFKGLVN